VQTERPPGCSNCATAASLATHQAAEIRAGPARRTLCPKSTRGALQGRYTRRFFFVVRRDRRISERPPAAAPPGIRRAVRRPCALFTAHAIVQDGKGSRRGCACHAPALAGRCSRSLWDLQGGAPWCAGTHGRAAIVRQTLLMSLFRDAAHCRAGRRRITQVATQHRRAGRAPPPRPSAPLRPGRQRRVPSEVFGRARLAPRIPATDEQLAGPAPRTRRLAANVSNRAQDATHNNPRRLPKLLRGQLAEGMRR